jgi:hypothetical protein
MDEAEETCLKCHAEKMVKSYPMHFVMTYHLESYFPLHGVFLSIHQRETKGNLLRDKDLYTNSFGF